MAHRVDIIEAVPIDIQAVAGPSLDIFDLKRLPFEINNWSPCAQLREV
jgi:hypothetical protein